MSEEKKRAFEIGVNTIALKISSPMGKVYTYCEWLSKLMPLKEWEADVAQDVIENAILGFDDHKAIENLYIDSKIISDFVPEDLLVTSTVCQAFTYI